MTSNIQKAVLGNPTEGALLLWINDMVRDSRKGAIRESFRLVCKSP